MGEGFQIVGDIQTEALQCFGLTFVLGDPLEGYRDIWRYIES